LQALIRPPEIRWRCVDRVGAIREILEPPAPRAVLVRLPRNPKRDGTASSHGFRGSRRFEQCLLWQSSSPLVPSRCCRALSSGPTQAEAGRSDFLLGTLRCVHGVERSTLGSDQFDRRSSVSYICRQDCDDVVGTPARGVWFSRCQAQPSARRRAPGTSGDVDWVRRTRYRDQRDENRKRRAGLRVRHISLQPPVDPSGKCR
jgi:hypothetical protein